VVNPLVPRSTGSADFTVELGQDQREIRKTERSISHLGAGETIAMGTFSERGHPIEAGVGDMVGFGEAENRR